MHQPRERRDEALTPFWSLRRFAELTRGQWLVPPSDADAPVAGVSIDSRNIAPGQAFIAIAGERFDGHDFLTEVAAKGAAFAIVERESSPLCDRQLPLLQVASTLTALQTLASAWRDCLNEAGCKIISVSGSNGKTTTRHLIHHVLTQAGYAGTQSPKER